MTVAVDECLLSVVEIWCSVAGECIMLSYDNRTNLE